MKKNIFKLGLVAILAVMPLIGQQLRAQAPANCGDVMLQTFYWDSYNDSKWTTLNAQAAEIGASFDLAWLPPSGKSAGMGYLDVYWYNQNSAFGTQGELKTLITSLKANNCKAIADIVINHRNGVTSWCDFPVESYNGTTYTPNLSWICNGDEAKANGYNVTGGNDTGENYASARDLDHTNNAVRDEIKGYMQFLKNEMGYAGWRYDLVKGYAGSYTKEYDDAAAGYLAVGEFYDTDYDKCVAWINSTSKSSMAFDFPFKGAVNAAFNTGNYSALVWKFLGTTNQPAGIIHNPDMRRNAVTFIENHDTPSYGLKFNGNIEAANAYMLSSPGIPCVWLSHWMSNKTAIKKMIAARKKAGVHSQSAVSVLQSAGNIYVGEATGTNGKLIVKVGPGSYSAPAGYSMECSGTDWAIWTNVSTNTPTLIVTNPGGTYIGGTTVTLLSTGGTPAVKIYYTLDGITTPTATSTLYTGSISISANNTVLKAIAIDALSQSSAVATHTYVTAVAPTLFVDKVGGVYVGGTTVTLSSTGGVAPVKIYYTVNNTTPTSASTLYTTPISIVSNNTVLQAVAIDKGGVASPIAIHTYVTNSASGIKVSFAAPASWTTVDCYVWKGTNTELAGAWPGTVVAKDNNGFYTFFVSDISSLPINIVFNNGNMGEQTIDLSTSADICWNYGIQAGTPAKYNVTVVDCPVITSLSQGSEVAKISIYPNPARESIAIAADLEIVSIQIYSINGMLVKEMQVESNKEQISISDLASGFYSVVANFENGGRVVSKLIKQ